MPLGSSLNSLLLLAKNLDTSKPTTYTGKKGKNDKPFVYPKEKGIISLPRGNISDSGYSKEYIDSFFNELYSDLSIRPNRILLVKGNKVIAERYCKPYARDSWDCVFSTSKTLVGLALGLLYDDGLVDLDKPVVKILGIEKNVHIARNKKITLRHLLTMSTGITFNEMESASSTKWVKSFFESNSKFKLGTKFEYNSMNTYIISACVEKLAGKKFKDLVVERIFNPLHANDIHIDTSLEGYFIGGWGLYILPEDMAKLGILVRDGGMYDGKQIISKEWIDMMSHTQYEATQFGHVLNYGFQMWADDKNNFCCFNGMYDQNIMIYRNSGVIVVTCCANSEAFHGGNLFKICAKYFAKKEPGKFELCSNRGYRDLKNYDEFMYYYDYLQDKEYKPIYKIANSCGILPLILQNELGTYAKGIKSVKFKKEGDTYTLIINEGHKEYPLKFDFKDGIRDTYEFYGNKFDCALSARFILSGKSEIFLVIRMFFLEFSSSRYFTIKFGKDKDIISMELSENPGLGFVYSVIEVQDETAKAIFAGITKTLNPAYQSGIIKNIFSPSFRLVHGETKYRKLKGEKIKEIS